MPRTAAVLLALLLTAVGCRREPPKVDVEKLPVFESKTGGELVLVPAGTFTMGDATGRDDETPHEVAVSSFYIDKTAVTQELYRKVMDANPSKQEDPLRPVERTQWT